MNIEINCDKCVLCGDLHGNLNFLHYWTKNQPDNTLIFALGDIGTGFSGETIFRSQLNQINEICKKKNSYVLLGRGNHDCLKGYFDGSFENFSNIILLEDYSVIKINRKDCLWVGGAISIDRKGRKEGISYWSDERFVYNQEKIDEIKKNHDIFAIFTHSAPDYCFPTEFSDIVFGWLKVDKTLEKDLLDERGAISRLYSHFSPKISAYCHFHSSFEENINDCKYYLLGIEEMKNVTNYFEL